MAHRNVGLSPSCMLVLLRMLFSCSAAVLFGAVRSPLLRPITPPNHNPSTAPRTGRTCTRAQLFTHFYSKTKMIVSSPNREDWICFAQQNVFFFFPFHCRSVTSLRVSWLYPVLSVFHPFVILKWPLIVHPVCSWILTFFSPLFAVCLPLTPPIDGCVR